MKKPKYPLDQLKLSIEQSINYSQVLIKLGKVPKGGNYGTLKNAIKYYKLDTSHFLGQGSNTNKVFGPKRPVEDYLSNKQTIKSYNLKKRLLKEQVLEHVCHMCKHKEWLNQPIALELHHIDGNSNNNNLTNLQLLCPNCHSQTKNYRRNKK